ncbi:MAG TPA: hypothetical protein PLN79_00200, partial [bacterium]|nr:hypothetical protein [bacterium]
PFHCQYSFWQITLLLKCCSENICKYGFQKTVLAKALSFKLQSKHFLSLRLREGILLMVASVSTRRLGTLLRSYSVSEGVLIL